MTFPRFSDASPSLLKKYLTPGIYENLRSRKTASGFTLEKAIRSGVANQDSEIGIYAGDEDSYTVFADIFDPVIYDYHKTNCQAAAPDFTCPDLSDPDPGRHYIRSTRVRLARNINGYCFPCHLSRTDRRQVENMIRTALRAMPADLAGDYHSLDRTDPGTLLQLKRENLIFQKGDRFQDAAGFNRHFPEHRGVFLSNDKNFMVWANEEDHLRIIRMEKSPDLAGVFRRIGRAVDALDKTLEFARDPQKGFLTSCPTNIGTTLRAGVHIRLEKLERHTALLHRLAGEHHLQIRGTGGEKTKVEQAVFDISNRRRLGLSESQIIQALHTGIKAVIRAEQSL